MLEHTILPMRWLLVRHFWRDSITSRSGRCMVKALWNGLHQRHSRLTVDKLIAQLDVIRTGGFAYDIEEHALGSCAIGLPIGIFGTTQLAVSVVIPTERYQEQKVIIENALRLSANDFAQRIDK